MDNPIQEEEGKLAYDLRQRYAKVVGDQLEVIVFFRRERHYHEWFRALEDLYTIVAHKIKDEDKEYDTIRNKIIIISNSYPESWKGGNQRPIEVGKIEDALREMERLLYEKMNDVGMFGVTWDDDGL